MGKKEKLDKQVENSINYFTKTDTLKYVGGGVLIAGLVSLWIGFGVVGFILAIIGTPTGLILYFIGASNKLNDADMDSTIENKMAGLIIDIDNDRAYKLKLLKHQSDVLLEGYKYGEGIMMKKLKSGDIRTSEFSRTKLRILSDRLYIVNREISLIYSDRIANNLYEITYDRIISIEIQRDEKKVIFNKSSYFTKPCELVITTDDKIIRLPCQNAVTSDDLVVTIKRQMEKWLKQSENND